jgi:hypothetical protein
MKIAFFVRMDVCLFTLPTNHFISLKIRFTLSQNGKERIDIKLWQMFCENHVTRCRYSIQRDDLWQQLDATATTKQKKTKIWSPPKALTFNNAVK